MAGQSCPATDVGHLVGLSGRGRGRSGFFASFDPLDLHVFGNPLDISREAFYTLGFFGYWGLGIGSSALTLFLASSPFDVDCCPLDVPGRAQVRKRDIRLSERR